jgi:hypothetical protein
MTAEPTTELAEISAAKDTVYTVLEQYLDCEEHDLIGIADRAVEALLKGGVRVPPWMPQPFNENRPAQGEYPTSSQMEAWNGRAVTPTRVNR